MMTRDPLEGFGINPHEVYDNIMQVEPRDDIGLPVVASRIYIPFMGSYFQMEVITAGGQRVTLPIIKPGLVDPPVRVRAILDTGTLHNPDFMRGTAVADESYDVFNLMPNHDWGYRPPIFILW